MRRLARAVVAAVAGVALLVASAAPSAATSGSVSSGTIGINFLLPVSVDLAPATGPCNFAASAVSMNMTPSGTNPFGLSTILTIDDADFVDPTTGATFFLDGISATATTGMLNTTPTPDTVTTGSFTSTVGNIYPETSPGSCVPGVTPRCSGVRLHPTSSPLNLSGSFPSGAGVAPPNVAGTAILSGTGTIQAVGCVPPFAPLNGRTMTISNLLVTFV